MNEAGEADTIPRRSRWRRVLIALLVVVLLSGAAAGGLWSVMGRPFSVPGWLRAKIEERIDTALPGMEIRFGDMQLELQRDLLARIRLVDVELRSETGAQVAMLADLEAALAPTKLLRRQYEVRQLRLSGAMLSLRRDKDGRLGLALGDMFSSETPAPDLPTLIAQVDSVLADPRLGTLEEVDADALTLRYEDARAQRGWTADGGRVRLTREGGSLRLSGDIALLGGGDAAATLAINAESPIGSTAATFGLNLVGLEAQDIATQSPALAWLKALRAPISGALRGSMTEGGTLGGLSATLQIGEGVLQPNPGTTPIPFRSARTYFSFDPANASLRFDEISVQSQLGTLLSDGRATLGGLDAGGWPSEMTGQFRISRLEADPEGFFDSPLSLSGAELDWRLQFDPFRFELGRFRSTDARLPLRLSGSLDAEPEGWRLAVDGKLSEISPEDLLSLWPEQVAGHARDWVAKNVYAGSFHDILVALRLDPGEAPKAYLDTRIDGAEITYSRTLPRITGGGGQLTIYDNRLSVAVEKGYITPPEGGVISVAGSSFVIPDTTEQPPRGEVNVVASAPLVALLSYLDSPKMEFLQKANKPVDLGRGHVTAKGLVTTPLKHGVKREEITIAFTGAVTDFESAEVVPGKVLSSDRLEADVNDDRLVISGAADLSGIPFRGSWTQSLIPGEGSRVVGDVTLSEAVAQAIGLGLPKGTFSGSGTGRISIALEKDQPPQLELDSDLAGLGVSLPPIGWRLSREATGKLSLAGALVSPMKLDRLSLEAPGLTARGSVELTSYGALARMVLPELKVGRWLDSSALLTGRGRNAAPSVALNGGLIDLRSAPFGSSGSGQGGSGGGGPVTLALNRLQVTDAIQLRDFKGSFDTAQGLAGNFTASVDGRAPISGQVAPQAGGTAIRIRSRDAGDVLERAKIFKSVQDGTFDLTLLPVAGRAGEYDGTLQIEGARLQNTPTAAALLDAMSVVGILDQLNGPGIFFSEIEAKFRLTPTQVILTRSSAVGPSMGISMDGYYDIAAGRMDMQGVLSPVYILNGIGQLFSRKGEGLIGFNFGLKGPVDQPAVSVNPLSVFTPGMFRDIFRRPPPTVPEQN